MKKFTLVLSLLFAFVALQSINAQSVDEMAKEWERAKTYTKEYLDAMPADKYDLKPTPEMRSFAEQMLHLADANFGIASVATGQKSPVAFGEMEKTKDKTKENVSKLVIDSYDNVITGIKKIAEGQLADKIKLFDRYEMSKLIALGKAFEHQTHHRGQTTVYIRLGGAKPPQEKLF